MRDAVLEPGDQVVFDAHHRFVVEAPARAIGGRDRAVDVAAHAADASASAAAAAADAATGSIRRLPWLLLAALLLAALLGALLLFGAG